MGEKPRSSLTLLGVRVQVWCAVVLGLTAVLLFYRAGMESENGAAASKASPSLTAARTATHPGEASMQRPVERSTLRTLEVDRARFLGPNGAMNNRGAAPPPEAGGMHFDTGGIAQPEVIEPVTWLVNELFSPSREARLRAATRLSRRSVYASEALPALKRALADEQDEEVRKRLKEAILNIRGIVAPPFPSLMKVER